jgi:NDP-sugar pyrophosphorylase family protein
MKAMVFAAGQGLRLGALTTTTPKALIPVAGRPMIEYPLRLLRHYGISEIIVNLHHLGEQIETYLGDGSKLGLRISYSKEAELLDTGGGLLKAKPFLQDGTFIVINTDVLIDLPLDEVIDFHNKSKTATTLVLRPDELADQYGSIEIDADGKIYRFLHAQRPEPQPVSGTKLMFTGVQILEPCIFDYMNMEKGLQKFGTTKHTYPRMLLEGEKLCGFYFDGFWQDVGTVDRIREAEETLAQGKAKLHYL